MISSMLGWSPYVWVLINVLYQFAYELGVRIPETKNRIQRSVKKKAEKTEGLDKENIIVDFSSDFNGTLFLISSFSVALTTVLFLLLFFNVFVAIVVFGANFYSYIDRLKNNAKDNVRYHFFEYVYMNVPFIVLATCMLWR